VLGCGILFVVAVRMAPVFVVWPVLWHAETGVQQCSWHGAASQRENWRGGAIRLLHCLRQLLQVYIVPLRPAAHPMHVHALGSGRTDRKLMACAVDRELGAVRDTPSFVCVNTVPAQDCVLDGCASFLATLARSVIDGLE
jgi:hypothetical protein